MIWICLIETATGAPRLLTQEKHEDFHSFYDRVGEYIQENLGSERHIEFKRVHP